MADAWVTSATGGKIGLDPIDVSQVNIRDISLGLARICRWNGQIQQLHNFFSVAEHCVWASYIAPPGYQLAALVHDAPEAIIGDVTSPLKAKLPNYKTFETRFGEAMRLHFGWPEWDNPTVKKADLQMLAIEHEKLMHPRSPRPDCLDGVEVPNVKLECWPPTMAWVVWEDRYNELKRRGR